MHHGLLHCFWPHCIGVMGEGAIHTLTPLAVNGGNENIDGCGRFTLSYTGEQYRGTEVLQKLPLPYFLKENLCIEWWKDSQQNLVRSLTGCRWPHWRSVDQMSGGSAADRRWRECWLVENFYPSCNILYCQQTPPETGRLFMANREPPVAMGGPPDNAYWELLCIISQAVAVLIS